MAYGLAIASIAAAVIGAGVSAYGAYQSGQTQNALATFNARQQEKQAQTQAMTMQVQAALKQREAETNFKLRTAESQARLNNAKNLEMQAAAQTRVNDINLQKRRLDFARAQSTQRAVIAESGVVESAGTPLDLLAETAGTIQRDQEEQHYESELQRRTLFSRPLKKDSAESSPWPARHSTAILRLRLPPSRGSAHAGEALAGIRQAEITRLTGGAAAQRGYVSSRRNPAQRLIERSGGVHQQRHFSRLPKMPLIPMIRSQALGNVPAPVLDRAARPTLDSSQQIAAVGKARIDQSAGIANEPGRAIGGARIDRQRDPAGRRRARSARPEAAAGRNGRSGCGG
jgi:hypothetical protein